MEKASQFLEIQKVLREIKELRVQKSSAGMHLADLGHRSQNQDATKLQQS
jgi:hypothetical protein